MYAQINGINLAFNDCGTGTPIVFLHAFPMDRTMWAPQEQALSTRFRVITIDLRGHGESDAPLWRYTMAQFADDVVRMLDHLAIQKAVFVGLSMGGYVSFALHRAYPGRTRALVLADTRAQADSEDGRKGRFNMAQIAYTKGARAIADLMLPKLLGPTALRTRPDLVQQVRATIERTQISGIAGDLMAMAERLDAVPILQTIACPTLVLVGEEDTTTPLAEAGMMADRIPGARLEVIPGAGHLSNLEQPIAFNRAIEDFTAGLAS